MTKKDIVKTISEECELTQLKTKEIVQRTLNAIVETLIQERRIELRNFGVFEVKKQAARRARNPRTGDPVEVEEKYVVRFKPGKDMEERVRQLIEQEEAQAAQEALADGHRSARGNKNRATQNGSSEKAHTKKTKTQNSSTQNSDTQNSGTANGTAPSRKGQAQDGSQSRTRKTRSSRSRNSSANGQAHTLNPEDSSQDADSHPEESGVGTSL